MGRTNPTYRDQLQAWATEFESFQHALVYERQEHAETVVEHAHQLAAAAGIYNATDPMETILLPICVAQQDAIEELRGRLTELEPDE